MRNLAWLIGSRGVNAAFSLLYLALAARNLGLRDFGCFALIVVMAQAVAGVASFSAWQAVLHWGQSPHQASPAAGFAIALDGVSIAAGSVVAVAVAWIAPLWLPLPPDLRPTALALCLATLVAIRSTPTGILRLHDRYDLAALAEATLPATRAAGAIAAALAWPTITGFAAAWAIAEIVCSAAYWFCALRLERIDRRDISLTRLPHRHPGAWRFVWATSLSRSLAVTSRQVLLLLVGAFGGAVLAGGFRVAAQLGQALVQMGEAVSRALYPELLRGRAEAAGLARRMARAVFWVGASAVTVTVLGGKQILGLIGGPGFEFAHGAMVLLALAGTLELVAASPDALLVSRGRALSVFLLRAVPLAGAMAVMPLAIRHFALLGAAGCVLLASAASMLGLIYAASLPAGEGARRR